MADTSVNANGTCASCGRSLFGKRKHEFNGSLYGGRCIYKVRGTGKLAAAVLGDGVTKNTEQPTTTEATQ